MALLKVGNKASIFVTHLEFVASECQIFCQVGDVGSQADTLAERVAECVENGLASPISQCSVGDLCLALFHEDNSWYRGRVKQNLGNSLKVYFIDYGNTEVVTMSNIREAPDYVLAIPALSTKCVVSDCTPLSGDWTEDEKKKIETLLHSGEFTCEIMGTTGRDVNNETYVVKLYTNDAPNTPLFVRPASSTSLSLKPHSLNLGQVYDVYIAFVESAKKFWVQLKSEENELNSLMTDIAACFAEDLPSTGDIVNPVNGQVCAACFSDDGAFYRGIVNNVKSGKCTVFFVDYGNREEKSTSELFTLPQALCKLPMQAIQCAYESGSSAVEDKLHELSEAENPLPARIVSGSAKSGYVIEMSAIDQKLSSKMPTNSQPKPTQNKSASKLWHSYSSVMMQVDAIYDVCISFVEHPGEFYIQLLGNADNLDTMMQAIDEVAHNYDKLTNLYPGYQCLGKFSDGSWYRCEVLASGPGMTTVAAVDFGVIESLPPSQLRNTDPNFKGQPAQAVKCSIDLNRTERSQWSAQEVEKFKTLTEKLSLVVKVTSKKGCTHQVELYETENGAERNLNAEFVSSSRPSETKSRISSPPKAQKMAATPPKVTFALPATPKISLAPPGVSVGMKLTLCFTALKQQLLYGQLTSTPVEKVAKLQTDVNSYFDKKRENIDNPDVGSVCCTQYIDGGWYRGIITALMGNKAEVAFVDFGDSVHKSVGDLKALPASLCELPQQCLLCKIDNVPSTVPKDKLEKVLVNKRVEVKLTQKQDDVYPTYHGEIVDRSVMDQLQDRPATQGAFKGASSRTFGKPPRDDNLVARKPIKRTLGDSYTLQEVAVNSTQDVMVTYVKDPACFQVVLDKMNATLDAVMDQLHEYYDKLPPNGDVLENPQLGNACVTQFTEDKGWYRAVITGLKHDGHAEVMFVDYGNNEYTDCQALKKIRPEFMELPAQAVQCRLSGVSSPQGFWSPEHTVQFSEMVEEQSFSTTFKTELHEQGCVIYKVELVDKKGTNVNEKFGAMTGTSCPETMSGPFSRSVSHFKPGDDMKITIGSGDNSTWNEGSSSRFGSKPKSFGGSSSQSYDRDTGDSGWDEGGDSGAKKSFGGRGDSGFGGGRGGGSGFGSSRGGGSGFGSSRGGGSGFGSSRGDGGGFGSSRGGFGSSRGGDGGGFGSSRGGDAGGGFGKSGGFGSGRDSGGGSKDCFKCGESGHFSRECPNAASKGGRDCYKCGEGGHIARDCPNPAKAGGGRECYKCGEEGHMARDCTNPPKAGGGGGRECYKCGESGHMARDCTNPPKAGGGRECYKCGESGHMARDCTNPPKEGAGPRRGGGFGSRSDSNSTSENWGDGGSSNQGGGFGSRGGGFGNQSGDRGGGFGQRSNESGGFGSKGGGFGKKPNDDWGSGNKPRGGFGSGDTGGFGNRSGGFGGNAPAVGSGDDDWGADTIDVSASLPKASPAGDGPNQVEKDCELEPVVLVNGDTVDVYVVYVASPELFYCQIIKNCPALEKLMDQLNSFYNGVPVGDLTFPTVEVGMPCAAKFSEDNMWYRARVISNTSTQVDVQFIDYGNTETVSSDKLKKLKPEFMSLKTQGIKCCLDDIVANKAWSDKATEDFEDMTHDKHLLARVNGVSSSTLTHMIDLENVDEKFNIAETMCDKGHCSLKPSKSSPIKVLNVKNPYSPPNLDGEIDVYVSWIENPSRFWVQPTSQENELLELVEKIQELYTSGEGVDLKSESFSVGQAVVAQFTEDEAWYRGFIERIAGDKCSVRFVDYGNSELVSKDLVRQPTDDIMKECAQAGVCKLVGIRPLQSGQWASDARDIMDGLVKDEVVKCKVVDSKDGFSVGLVAKGVDVSEELVKAAVVKKVTQVTLNVPPVGSSMILHYGSKVSLEPGIKEAVYVSHTDSVASFSCQLLRNVPQLDKLMAQLETHCQTSVPVTEFPVGLACAAKFSEDGQWYRSEVTASFPDNIEVLFVDYGNTEKVPRTDICQLNDEHVLLPPQAIECELVNCSSASNQSTCQFTELIGDHEVTAAIVDINDDCAIVQIILSDGKVVGEELGLSERGSTMITAITEESSVASPAVVSTGATLTYPDVVMPSSAMTVFVTQIINPGEFYLQRADQEKQLTEFMASLAQFCSSDAKPLTSVSDGQACCAKFSEDGNWYRGRILRVDGSKIEVEFVDYGNTEKTTSENIRNISQDFVSTPLFALRCSLEGVCPLEGSWTDDAVKKLEDLAVGKDLVCEVVKGSEVFLTCEGTDIAGELIASGLVKEIKGRKTKLAPVLVAENPALYFAKPKLPCDPSDVYISHVNSPGDFYVQMASQEDYLSALMEKIASVYETSGQILENDKIKIGQAVCAKYSEDEAWYRAEVVSVDGKSISVQFVDYGNSEQTTCDNLKAMTEDLVKAPMYAIKCSLGNAKPCSGEWSEESKVFLETLTAEKVIHCEFIGTNSVCLTIDGKDVLDGLIEKGYAEKLTVISPTKRKGEFMPQSVPAGSVSCYVSHIDDNGTFYLHLVCEEDRLNSLVEEVQTLESRKPVPLSDIKEGDNVCSKFTEDESWYRAVVIDTSGESVKVRFVDYGNCDTLSQSDDFRTLPADLLVTPPFAYACCLQGQPELYVNQVNLFREVTTDKELTATFNTCSAVFEIQLLDENEKDIGNMVKELVTEDTAVAESTSNLNTEPKVTAPETNADETSEPGETSDSELTTNVYTDFPDASKLLKLEIASGERVNILVSHSESPSKFWIQFESAQENLDNLLTKMCELYSSSTDTNLAVDAVSEGMLVAALYSEDDAWYRANVISCDNNTVTVIFIDHGNTQTVEKSDLRRLPSDFCTLPIQAIQCTLGAVQPSSGQWTDEAKETFAELTHEKVLLLDVGSKDDDVYKVQLLDMGMSVSEKLLQKNIGIEIATPVAVSTKVKQVFSPENTDQVIARLYDAKSRDKVGKYGYNLREISSNDPTVSSHNVVITAIESPLNFWCRLQDSTYSFYQDKLQEDYASSKEPLSDMKPGEKCVCIVEDDYHRGSIIECNENKVRVKLIDTGGSAEIDLANDKVFELKEQFVKYPQLAFNCCLSGRTQVVSELKNDAGNVFKETVTELNEVTDLPASARASVVSEDSENEIIVVRLTIDRKDIAESLVEKGVIEVEEANEDSIQMIEEFDDTVENEFGTFKYIELEKDQDYDVILIDCIDMNKLVFHTKEGLEELDAITMSIAEYVKDKEDSGGLTEDNLSGPCLAKCPTDKTWYRANIISGQELKEESQLSKYQVFLVDYGSTYYLPKTSLLPLPDALCDKPGQAVICHLGDIAPVDEDWSDDCYTFFKEQYMTDGASLAMYVNDCHKGMHEILLSDTKASEKSINFLLIEVGLAVPIDMGILAETTETSFHELSMSRQDSLGDSSELGDTSFEPDSSCCPSELDTSAITDTSRCTEQDTSCFTEGDTSYMTETDMSYHTDRDTSVYTESDTSQFSTANESSYLADGDVSNLTDGETSGVLQDSSVNVVKLNDDDVCSDNETDTSVNTLDGTKSVCEDRSAENEGDESGNKEEKEIESIDIHIIDKEIINTDAENMDHQVDDIKVEDTGNDMIGNNIELNIVDQDKGLELSPINSDMDGEPFPIGLDIEAESVYSTTDVDPNSTEESDIDISYRRFKYSPTGYTTSEIDTTDLRDLDETTETADIDTTGLTDYDTTGIEGGGEELSILDDGTEINNVYDSEEHEEAGTNVTVDDIAEQVVVIDENSNIENMDILKTGKEPVESCEVPLSDCKPLETSIDEGKHLFPSVSDTTYPSTFTSISDFTFTSAYDTSQTDNDMTYEGAGDKRLDSVFDEKVVVQYIEIAETEGQVVEIALEECNDKEDPFVKTNDNVKDTNDSSVTCSDARVENESHTQIGDLELKNETRLTESENTSDDCVSVVPMDNGKELDELAEMDSSTLKPIASVCVDGISTEGVKAKVLEKKHIFETNSDDDVCLKEGTVGLETDELVKEFEDLSRKDANEHIVSDSDSRTDACEFSANVCDVSDGACADSQNDDMTEVLSIIDSICSIVVEQLDTKMEGENKEYTEGDASDQHVDGKESEGQNENLPDVDTFHIAFEEIQNDQDVNTVYIEEIIIPDDDDNQVDALCPVNDINDCPNTDADGGISVQGSDVDKQDEPDNLECIISLDISVDREETGIDREDIGYGNDMEVKTTREHKSGEEIESENVNVVIKITSHEKHDFENVCKDVEEHRQIDEAGDNMEEISEDADELHQIIDSFDKCENTGKDSEELVKVNDSFDKCENTGKDSEELVKVNDSFDKCENTGKDSEELVKVNDSFDKCENTGKDSEELVKVNDSFDKCENTGKDSEELVKVIEDMGKSRNEAASGPSGETNVITTAVEENVAELDHFDSVVIKDEESIEGHINENTNSSDYAKEELADEKQEPADKSDANKEKEAGSEADINDNEEPNNKPEKIESQVNGCLDNEEKSVEDNSAEASADCEA